ncbi:MAG: hypothetical protein ABIC40_04395 [bacterium]
MNFLKYCATIFLLLVLGLSGCGKSPLDPNPEQNQLKTQSVKSDSSPHHLWGFGLISIDTQRNTIEILPVRSANLHLNLTGVLNNSMGVTAALGPGSDPVNGLFVMDITLTHPFGTKPQLAGFDVKGILITPGTLEIDGKIFADIDETRLENADGYTRWWNPTEFTSPGFFGYIQGNLSKTPASSLTATVNPYKYFADLLWPEQTMGPIHGEPMDNDMGRGVFRAGESNTRRYMIRFPMNPAPQVIFGYAIDASWAMPSPNPPGEIPDDFPINANEPEPYDVWVGPIVNTLYYDTESGIGGGVFRLQANVHDWQGQAAANIAGEVSDIRAFSPDMFSGGKQMNFFEETPLKAKYSLDLTGQAKPTHAGKTVLAVKAVDSGGLTYNQSGAPAPSETLASWSAITLDIPDPECTGDANNDWLEAVPIEFGVPVTDQLCLAADYRDFFTFEIPVGSEASGQIGLYCDAEPTLLGVYDHSQTLIDEASISSGMASLDFESLHLVPGDYYIRVLTSNAIQTAPYLLELNGELQNVTPLDPVEITPDDLYVNPRMIWINGNYIYMAGYGVWVYDISDPANPVQVSYKKIYVGGKSCFSYPYLYFTDQVGIGESQINMVDFTEILNPVLHEDVIHYMGKFDTLCMNSTHLYIGHQVQPTSDISIYDYASDPFAPIEVGNFPVPYTPQVMALMDPEGPETRLIVATWDDLLSFDVEDPSSVTPTGTYNFPSGSPRCISIHQNWIYLGFDLTSGGEGMLLLFYQTANNVISFSELDIPGFASYNKVDWPYVYFGDGSAGLTVCDVTNPSTPALVGSVKLLSDGTDLAISDDTLYIIPRDAGLQIFDVSIPQTPAYISHLHVLNSPYAIVPRDNYLIAAEIGSGFYGAFKTVDISDPANTHVVAEYYPPVKPTMLSQCGDMLASAGFKSWMLLDASDPLDLKPYYIKTEGDYLGEIGLWNDALYVYENIVGYPVRIYDVSNPYLPHYEGTIAASHQVRDFTFIGDIMYVVVGATIEVYSLLDPFNPNYLGSYGSPLTGYGESEIIGNKLYIGGYDFLEIADISTPSAPVFLGSEAIPNPGGFGYDFITVEGQYAYLDGYSTAPYSCSVFPPDNPTGLDFIYDTFAYGSRDLLARDGILYEASEGTGLHIFDLY